MINTVSIKSEQLTKGYFEIGSGAEKVLIMGSCRVAPYCEYLNEWNIANGNRFTIYSLDPFNWCWNAQDERTDYDAALLKMETFEPLLSMLSSVDIFIHEWYQNAGMFNVSKADIKTIYNFGMNPKVDICIPSWNDHFVLFKDIFNFDIEIRKIGIQDINVTGKLSEEIQKNMYEISQRAIRKFCGVCLLSDIPDMRDYFEKNFIEKRLFHNYNHVNKNFTMAIFNFLDTKFLKLNLPDNFYDDKEDMFASNYTPLTQYDLDWFGYQWNEEIKPIL